MKSIIHYITFILLLFWSLFAQAAAGTTYTAINTGTYANTTNVWSTNGTTACGCTPGATLGNKDKIIINTGITVTAAATTNIVNGNSNAITVNGTLTVNGSVTTGNSSTIDVNANGIFNIVGGDLIIDQNSGTITVQPNGQLNVDGDFEAKNGSTFVIEAAGTFDVTGNFDVKQNSDATINGDVTIGLNTTFGANVRMTLDGSFMMDGTLDVESFKDLFGTGEIGIGGVSCGFIDCNSDCADDINAENIANTSAGSTDTDVLCGNFSGAGILPVKFISFSSTTHNITTQLNWSTTEENNNSHFVIEESFDGEIFIDKGIVDGVGNTSIIQNYSFSLPFNNQTTYYRLRQVDLNGQFDYSKTIIHTNNSTDFSIYPNPSTSKTISLSFEQQDVHTFIQVTNELGQSIHTTTLESADTYTFSLEKSGFYFVKVIQENNVITKKLVLR